MSAETEAYLIIYGGLAGFGIGMGIIAITLSRTKPKWWISYVAYAGFAVLWGNGFNFFIDPSRYSSANALSSLIGCSNRHGSSACCDLVDYQAWA